MGDAVAVYWRTEKTDQSPAKTHLIAESRDKTVCGRPFADIGGRQIIAEEYECGDCFIALKEGVRAQPLKQLRFEPPEPPAPAPLWQPPAPRLWQPPTEWIPGDEWMELHRQYLRTAEWSERHEEVMEREDDLCEACRKRRATEVHHATYKHWRNEPLFELHAVCKPCHDLLTMLDRARRARMRSQ